MVDGGDRHQQIFPQVGAERRREAISLRERKDDLKHRIRVLHKGINGTRAMPRKRADR